VIPSRTAYQRQRRQRGLAKVKSHRYYMKHRAQNKMRARKRYKRMRNNPAFKRRQRLYRMNPQRFMRRTASFAGFDPIPFWSASLGDGLVVGVDDDEVFYTLLSSPEDLQVIYHQDFLDTAAFLEDADIESFFSILDEAMGVPLVVSAVSDALVSEMEAHEV
jgi:hypothetical protein